MLADIELQPGQTVVVKITKYLEYRITHTGWVLDVTSTKPIGVKPKDENALSIISLGTVEDDEV